MLSLRIRRTTTGNRDGHVDEMEGSGYSYNRLAFGYDADAGAMGRFDNAVAKAVPLPRQPFAKGWYVAVPQGNTGAKAYFHSPTGGWTDQIVGYQTLADIDMISRLDSHFRLGFTVAHDADPARWQGYRDKARTILAWLEKPPAKRDNAIGIEF